MQLNVSVILPVYNTAPYLGQCLDSILAQTLQNFEIICVDDGSTDGSLELLEQYQNKDSRIRVIKQKNLYAGVARNKGLEVAQGEYVIFLDSDDFFEPQMLQAVYEQATQQDADVVLFGGRTYHHVKQEYRDMPSYLRKDLIGERTVFNRNDLPDNLLTITTPAPWTKAFRRSFILAQQLQFQPLQNSNDVYFTMCALALAERITWVNLPFTNYRIGQGGNIQSGKAKNPCCFVQAYAAIHHTLQQHQLFPLLKKSYCKLFFSGILFNLNTMTEIIPRQKILSALAELDFLWKDLLNEPAEFYADFSENYKKIKDLVLQMDTVRQNGLLKQYSTVYECLQRCTNQPYAVSVIVPIYNIGEYLKPCLDSIVNQTLKNIQIICVNDGSEDQSLEIALDYARRDSRFTVISQKNSGLSVARNHGLKEACGEYIYFMDGDDILSSEALEELYRKACAEDLSIIYFDADCFSDDPEVEEQFVRNNIHLYHRRNDYSQARPGIDMLAAMESNRELYSSCCLQFIRRSCWQELNLWFIPGILHEDNLFTCISMCCSPKTAWVPNCYFKRRYRKNSIMTQQSSFAHSYGYYRSYIELVHRFENETNWTDTQAYYVRHFMHRLLQNAIRIYADLSFGAKFLYCYLPLAEAMEFSTLVIAPAAYRVDCFQKQALLQKTYDEKAERGLQIKELRAKLQKTYDEKAERGIQLKELRAKLQKTYDEKAERGVQLKELRAKLQKTYDEKAERGLQIKELQQETLRLKQQNQLLLTAGKPTFLCLLLQILLWLEKGCSFFYRKGVQFLCFFKRGLRRIKSCVKSILRPFVSLAKAAARCTKSFLKRVKRKLVGIVFGKASV